MFEGVLKNKNLCIMTFGLYVEHLRVVVSETDCLVSNPKVIRRKGLILEQQVLLFLYYLKKLLYF